MLEPMPCASVRPLGFQAAAKVSPLNQNQPMIEIMPTGMITPQTVIEPMRPVMRGPPKFAAVVSHRSAMSPMQVMIGRRREPRSEAGEVADRGDADRDVADGERQEVEQEHQEIARLSVGVLGIGRHAAGALIEQAGLGEAVGDRHRADGRDQPGQERDGADLRHVRRQHDDARAHHVHRDDERELDQVHLLLHG